MKVTTAKPLTMDEMMELSEAGDAIITLGGWKCRYMRATEGQEMEVPYTYYENGLAFGLRPVGKKKGYEYLAFRIY